MFFKHKFFYLFQSNFTNLLHKPFCNSAGIGFRELHKRQGTQRFDYFPKNKCTESSESCVCGCFTFVHGAVYQKKRKQKKKLKPAAHIPE